MSSIETKYPWASEIQIKRIEEIIGYDHNSQGIENLIRENTYNAILDLFEYLKGEIGVLGTKLENSNYNNDEIISTLHQRFLIWEQKYGIIHPYRYLTFENNQVKSLIDDIEFNKSNNDSKLNALCIAGHFDPPNLGYLPAFTYLGERLEKLNFAYKLHIYECSNKIEAKNIINKLTLNDEKLDLLILALHGENETLIFGDKNSKGTDNLYLDSYDFFSLIANKLSTNGVLLLDSCYGSSFKPTLQTYSKNQIFTLPNSVKNSQYILNEKGILVDFKNGF